jgi:hypothetical protein
VRSAVLDLLYVALPIIFLYISAAFTRGCEKLAKEEQGG